MVENNNRKQKILKICCSQISRSDSMAVPLVNNEQGNGGNTMDETPPLQIMTQEVSKETIADWKDSAAEYVRSEMFDKKQFVTDQELVVGGTYKDWSVTRLILVVMRGQENSGMKMGEEKLSG